jgi:hypothetical protein
MPAPPSGPTVAPPSTEGQVEPKLEGSSGLHNSAGATTYDAAILNSRSVGCEKGIGDVPSNSIRDNYTVICEPPAISPSVAQAVPPQR